jgi:uroporphyrinogen-III synthase
VAELQTLALRSATSGSRVIHFGALEPAGDFAGYLSRRGFDAVHVPVYETAPCVEGADLLLAGNSVVDGVLVHSPKAGRLLASGIERTRWKGMVACLSEACAAELRHLPSIRISIARVPTERSLLSCLADCFNIRRPPLADAFSPRHQAALGRGRPSLTFCANDNWPPSPQPA